MRSPNKTEIIHTEINKISMNKRFADKIDKTK